MEQQKVKEILENNKTFLKSILNRTTLTRKFLFESTDEELKCLLYLFHYVANRTIEISSELVQVYKTKRKVLSIQKLADEEKFNTLISAPRRDHLDALSKLLSVVRPTVECLK